AMLFFDSAGKKIVVIKPIEPQDNPCRNGLGAFADTLGVPGATLIGALHTHPAAVGDTVNCRDGVIVNGYSNQFGGPSAPDWSVAKGLQSSNPPKLPKWYAVDKNNIYSYDPTNVDFDWVTQPNGQTISVPHIPGQTNPWTNGYNSYVRNSGVCTIF
ncbi:MAG: hypothetical protein ACRENU_06640, partial [Gemmatimonadaceae bacterium]